MTDLKEILGEDLFNQVQEKVKGAGSNGKDVEVIATNTGDYVPAKKYEDVKSKYEKYKNDYDTLNSNYDVKIKEAESKSYDLLKKTVIENKLEAVGVAKINNSYDAYLNSNSVDLTKVAVADGKLSGVDELVSDFVTLNPHLVVKAEVPKGDKDKTPANPNVIIPAVTGINPANNPNNVKDALYYKTKLSEAVANKDLVSQAALIREAGENKIIIN